MGVVHLGEDEMAMFRDRRADDPAVIADSRIKTYAEEQGGLALAYWKLAMGRVWGDPIMMTDDEAAARLDVPLGDVDAIFDETMNACGYGSDSSGSRDSAG